jgi:hypothetical protein
LTGTILSLCDRSGNWSRPYEEAGYRVIRLDLADGRDVRLLRVAEVEGPVTGILAAPPCDHFSKAGAWCWERKGDAALLEGLSVVDACLRLVAVHRPDWWALENPAGRLKDFLGPPAWSFDPCQFGDLADDPGSEAYTKRTYLWGNFTPPMPLMIGRDAGVPRVLYGVPGGNRDRTTMLGSRNKVARSTTPTGFARAFYLSNP